MRAYIVTVFIFFSFILPGQVSADDEAISIDAERIRGQIEDLLKQIDALKEKLSEINQIEGRVVGPLRSSIQLGALQEATYYDGRYIALYEVQGTRLLSVGKTNISQEDGQIWDMFLSIAGNDFVREKIKEFRLYDSAEAEHDGFVERFAGEEKWILGVNIYDLDLNRSTSIDTLRDLLIHEFGHILIDEHQDILPVFTEQFWTERDSIQSRKIVEARSAERKDVLRNEYYVAYRDRFVTPYATSEPIEDLIESFVVFTTEPRRARTDEWSKKVNFFYDYNVFVNVRQRIQ